MKGLIVLFTFIYISYSFKKALINFPNKNPNQIPDLQCFISKKKGKITLIKTVFNLPSFSFNYKIFVSRILKKRRFQKIRKRV